MQPKKDMKCIRRRSYLLRLWRNEGTESTDWRASLEILGNGERIGFSSLEELFTYLMDQTTTNLL